MRVKVFLGSRATNRHTSKAGPAKEAALDMVQIVAKRLAAAAANARDLVAEEASVAA